MLIDHGWAEARYARRKVGSLFVGIGLVAEIDHVVDTGSAVDIDLADDTEFAVAFRLDADKDLVHSFAELLVLGMDPVRTALIVQVFAVFDMLQERNNLLQRYYVPATHYNNRGELDERGQLNRWCFREREPYIKDQ